MNKNKSRNQENPSKIKVQTKGYKNTEIGIIPEDWEVISFNQAFHFLSTASYSRAEITKNADIKYVHYGDIHTKLEHFLDFKHFELPTIKNEQLKTYSLIKEGDLIMADASEDYEGIGKSVEVKNIENNKAISGLHTFLLRGKEGVFSNGFKAYLHSNKIIKTQYDKLATGLKVYGVSKGNLKQIQIPLPPLPEQTTIATVLSDTDSLIQALEKKIAKKQLIKKGAMQKLLSPKEGWEENVLPKVCWFQEGPGLRNWQFTKKGMKVINVTNLVDGHLNLDRTDRHISMQEFEKMYKHFEINDKDIVMASSGNSYSKVAVVRKQDLRLLMNTSVIRFKPLNGLDYNYLLIFLKSNLFKDQIDLLITGGAQPNFGPAHLKQIKIPLPPTKEEQISIATIITDIDTEIKVLEKKLIKYKQLKQGLMQKLLTGAIRLTVTSQIENKVANVTQEKELSKKNHNWAINEAVIISVLSNKFGSKEYPLGRKRYTKLSYLLHRHNEQETIGYRKKAAGPYNPDTKYKGPENIAIKNKYVERSKKDKYNGFVAAENITQAEEYFEKWYGQEVLQWIEQFKYEKNDTLELWATVDMAIKDLEKENKQVSTQSVKNLINNHKEWKPKLKRPIFSDSNIKQAIEKVTKLFS